MPKWDLRTKKKKSILVKAQRNLSKEWNLIIIHNIGS